MPFSFEHAFTVKAPADKVFAYLTDPYRVAPALPGAALGEKNDDGSYSGTITVKVGPVSARYRGKARFDNLDAAGRSVSIVASGQDTSGRGGADMRMQGQLVESASGETKVSIRSEVNVTGILAQFGRGMIQDVSNQIFQKFSDAVRTELEKEGAPAAQAADAGAPPPPATASLPAAVAVAAGAGGAPPVAPSPPPAPVPPPASPPVDIVSLGGKAMGRAALRSVGRPAIWVVLLTLLVVLYWFLHR
jgi:carbon monoxide dehydrogenase subunit G